MWSVCDRGVACRACSQVSDAFVGKILGKLVEADACDGPFVLLSRAQVSDGSLAVATVSTDR